MRWLHLAAALGVEAGAHRQVLLDGEVAEHAVAAGELHDARGTWPAARATTYVMFWPLSRTTPRSGTASPLITRSAVDFPAPLVPSSATVSPFRTSKSTPKSTCTGP